MTRARVIFLVVGIVIAAPVFFGAAVVAVLYYGFTHIPASTASANARFIVLPGASNQLAEVVINRSVVTVSRKPLGIDRTVVAITETDGRKFAVLSQLYPQALGLYEIAPNLTVGRFIVDVTAPVGDDGLGAWGGSLYLATGRGLERVNPETAERDIVLARDDLMPGQLRQMGSIIGLIASGHIVVRIDLDSNTVTETPIASVSETVTNFPWAAQSSTTESIRRFESAAGGVWLISTNRRLACISDRAGLNPKRIFGAAGTSHRIGLVEFDGRLWVETGRDKPTYTQLVNVDNSERIVVPMLPWFGELEIPSGGP